jgi:hypothetical protein
MWGSRQRLPFVTVAGVELDAVSQIVVDFWGQYQMIDSTCRINENVSSESW